MSGLAVPRVAPVLSGAKWGVLLCYLFVNFSGLKYYTKYSKLDKLYLKI